VRRTGTDRLGREAAAAAHGIGAAPEGGAALAAIRRLAAEGTIRRHERVVLFNTGGAFKTSTSCTHTADGLELAEPMRSRGVVMELLGWILFGAIVGVVAKLLMPGRDPGGFIVTILLGIAGALLGGWIGRALGMYGPADGAGFLMSVLGAIVLLALYRIIAGRRTVL
jgi:uncharacterized membrane protein YeaQ/YmgE (transglycosylase-associated protein family)